MKSKEPLRFADHCEWKNSSLPQDQILGPSPGGAASELGVSRAVIYLWVKRGFLDVVYIGRNGRDAVFVSTASIKRVQHILYQLRLEWKTENLHGFPVSQRLERDLPQLDLFLDQ